MPTSKISVIFFVTAMMCVANVPAAEEPSPEVNQRFTQSEDRTFKAFDPQHEQTWQRPFFFMQLADTQYGMFTGNKAKHILMFQHHPLFLAKEDEPDQYFNIPLERRTPLLDQLKEADVRAVFAGHYHRNAYGDC